MKLFEHVLATEGANKELIASAKRVKKQQIKKAEKKAYYKLVARLKREQLEKELYDGLTKAEYLEEQAFERRRAQMEKGK